MSIKRIEDFLLAQGKHVLHDLALVGDVNILEILRPKYTVFCSSRKVSLTTNESSRVYEPLECGQRWRQRQCFEWGPLLELNTYIITDIKHDLRILRRK